MTAVPDPVALALVDALALSDSLAAAVRRCRPVADELRTWHL
jgi:hypothetical protein